MRPFTLVEDMQNRAEAQFHATEQALQAHLDDVQKKLRTLRTNVAGKQARGRRDHARAARGDRAPRAGDIVQTRAPAAPGAARSAPRHLAPAVGAAACSTSAWCRCCWRSPRSASASPGAAPRPGAGRASATHEAAQPASSCCHSPSSCRCGGWYFGARPAAERPQRSRAAASPSPISRRSSQSGGAASRSCIRARRW